MEKQNSNEVIIKLHEPIQWSKNEDEITELKIKAPRGKHLATLPKDYAIKDLARVAAKASGYEEALLGELHMKDYLKVIEVTTSFLEDGN